MTIRKTKGLLALILAPLSLWLGEAQAILISVTPASQDAVIGDIVTVAINVSDLGPTDQVGGFSATLSFDDAILAGLGYVLDPSSVMGALDDLSFGFLAGGVLDLFFGATSLELPAQGTGFTLTTLSFEAIGNGNSPISLSTVGPGGIFLSDELGFELATLSSNGRVCVGPGACGQVSVPEPGMLVLLSSGLLLLAGARRRRSAAKSI